MLGPFSSLEYLKKLQMFSRYLDQKEGNYSYYVFLEEVEFVWVDLFPVYVSYGCILINKALHNFLFK